MYLTLENITKVFAARGNLAEVVAVQDVDLEIQKGELVTLLGPSGCGKTTTLRMIAGFEFPTSGRIVLDGQEINSLPPHKRDMSMVFQSYAIFPHLTVEENLRTGLAALAGRGTRSLPEHIFDLFPALKLLTSRKGGFDTHLGAFPILQERLHMAPHGPDRAAGPLRQKVSSRTAGRVLLVGDAAGYVDALTGEGLGIAFGAANLLVECVAADRPQDYDRRWRRMSRRYRMLTAGVLHASGSPLRSVIVPAAAQFPAVFSRIVNKLAD